MNFWMNRTAMMKLVYVQRQVWTIYKAHSWKLTDILHKWPQKTELNTERLSMCSMCIGSLLIMLRFDKPINGEIYFNLNQNITRMHMPAGQKKLLMHGNVKYKNFYGYPFFLYHSDFWFLLFPWNMEN